MESVQVLRFFNILCAAIVAGGMVMVLMTEDPLKGDYPFDIFLPVHYAIGRRADWYMPAVTFLSALTAILILVFGRHLTVVAVACTATGLAFTVVVIVISQFGNVRLNRTIHSWSLSAPPPTQDYLSMRRRWDLYHTLRTLAEVVALILFTIAALAG